MTTPAAPDLPLPGDWSRGRLVGLSLLGQALLLALAVRHRWIWGGGLHPLLHALEALGLLLAATLSGLVFVRAVRQASSLPLALLLRGGVLLTLAATLVPPFLSSDIFDYLARGRVEVLGHNPYTTPVQALATDPRMAGFAGLAQWDQWVMPYGPVCALLQRLCAQFDAVWAGVYLWKLVCAGAHVLTSLLLLRTLRLLAGERDARRGLVLWLWNPWLLLECCGSGHNDALQALLLAATCLALAQQRHARSAIAFGLSLLVKHGSAPVGPLLLATAVHQRAARAFAVGAAATLALAAAAGFHYWSGPGGFDWLLAQGQVARSSLPALAAAFTTPVVGKVVTFAGLLLLLLVLARGCRAARDGVACSRFAVLAMIICVILCVPNFAPWYHLWWLPWFALAGVPTLTRVLELLAFTGPLSYLVFAGTHAFGPLHEGWQFVLAGLWPALLVGLDWHSLLDAPAAPKKDAGGTPGGS